MTEQNASQLGQQLQMEQTRDASERTRLNERYDAQVERAVRDIDRLQQSQKEDKKLLKELRAQVPMQ